MGTGENIRSAAREYAFADDRRGWSETVLTTVLYVCALSLAIYAAEIWWVLIPAMLLTAILCLRIYMIQHDCIHHAMFSSRMINRVWGQILSVVSMTPYETTRRIHNLHHNHVSDLDRRDTFEIPVMTLAEWQQAGFWRRIYYRIYRSPILLIFIGPFLLYGFVRRLPVYGKSNHYLDLVLHNSLLAGFIFTIYALSGWQGVAVWVGTFYLASFGAIIPYVLHNFEEVHWGVKPDLDFETAALEGSSVLDWGKAFDLATLNIGYHDLHHLNAKLPGYRLRQAHNELEARGLLTPRKIGFIDGLKCLRWKLYDEDKHQMIGFPSSRQKPVAVPAE